MNTNTAEAINKALYRHLKDGEVYDALMPKSDCSSVKLGKGDTKVAIDKMAIWTKKYQHHTKRLASLFSENSLGITCTNLHQFMYHHFQYKIDGYEQKLRSPACAWFSRKTGLDCKSYSVFISSVLLNLGVSHFLRRIKLDANVGFSHVYVIVSKNKTNPKDLSKGYYTIDGTLENNKEPNFFIPDDLYMEAELPIYGLAGATQAQTNEQTATQENVTNSEVSAVNPLQASLLSGASQFVDIAVAALIDELIGCGDSLYREDVVLLKLERDFAEPLKARLQDLSDAISWNNRTRIQSLFNDLLKEFDLGVAHLQNETAYSADNNCIAQLLKTALTYVLEVKGVIDNFYENFLTTFSRYKIDEYTKTGTTEDRTLYFVVEQGTSPIEANYRFINLREVESKYGIDPVLPYGKDLTEWLLENKSFLRKTYGDGRDVKFASEVQPILNKVNDLRNAYYLDGQSLYLLEKPFQREMYKVWLVYDTNYTDFILQEAESFKTANEMAMIDFEERLEKEIEKDKKAKSLTTIKKTAGYGALAVASLLIIKQ